MADHTGELGGPEHLPHHPVGWSLAMNTPYRWTKSVASHFGETRNGMIVQWPDGVADPGAIRHHWHHVNDVYSTVLDAADIEPPSVVGGVAQQPLDGTSMRYSFDEAAAHGRRTTQYFETVGNRGIYHEGWVASAKHRAPWEPRDDNTFDEDPWELYDLETDWTQAHDLASVHPDRLLTLLEVFTEEATRNQVLRLDHRYDERANPPLPDVPTPSADGRR